jgi:hypothetical protein
MGDMATTKRSATRRTSRAALQRRCDAQREQIAELVERCGRCEHALEAMTTITSMQADEHRVEASIAVSHQVVEALTGALAPLLARAKNYVEMRLNNRNGDAYCMTLRRAERPTPHDLRTLAEERLAVVTEELRLAHEELRTLRAAASGG